jgi:hypothetical protein
MLPWRASGSVRGPRATLRCGSRVLLERASIILRETGDECGRWAGEVELSRAIDVEPGQEVLVILDDGRSGYATVSALRLASLCGRAAAFLVLSGLEPLLEWRSFANTMVQA